MAKPWMIVTGATGFLGGQLVRQLRKEYRIHALGRRPPAEVGAPTGEGIEWHRVDIGDFPRLRDVFDHIRSRGGADLLLHMAAYYDFTGDDHSEYRRTNVEGTRNIIELSIPLKLRRFIYTSSVAACPFPEPGAAVTEETPPEAPVPYARSKRACEKMLRDRRDRLPSCIVRPAAVFSDWCEYEPLDEFLRAWCSRRWNSRILGGHGSSAIPYLHVEDLLSFFVRVVERCDDLEPAEVLIASPDGSTSHRELFDATTSAWFGAPRRAVAVPAPLAAFGIRMRERLGRFTGRMPFERSWMVDYIDLKLDVDATRTRRRLDWAPNRSLRILECIPRMIGNLRDDRTEWRRRSEMRRRRHEALSRTSGALDPAADSTEAASTRDDQAGPSG